MLRTRYATEVQTGTNANATGIEHHGPGQITYKNILFVGSQNSLDNKFGFSAPGSRIFCVGCSAWGAGDSGF